MEKILMEVEFGILYEEIAKKMKEAPCPTDQRMYGTLGFENDEGKCLIFLGIYKHPEVEISSILIEKGGQRILSMHPCNVKGNLIRKIL